MICSQNLKCGEPMQNNLNIEKSDSHENCYSIGVDGHAEYESGVVTVRP